MNNELINDLQELLIKIQSGKYGDCTLKLLNLCGQIHTFLEDYD